MEYLNQHFNVRLIGKLIPTVEDDMTYLQGEAYLEVNVELPPALWLTPPALLESAGNALLMSVLKTIEQRLMDRLVTDYLSWANDRDVGRTYRKENCGNSLGPIGFPARG
jgi:Protein of unknown function (DUF1997)